MDASIVTNHAPIGVSVSVAGGNPVELGEASKFGEFVEVG